MSHFFKPEPKPVKPLETVLDAVLDREGWDTMPVTDDALERLVSTFAKPRELFVVEVKTAQGSKPKVVEAKIDNNGWGRSFTPEQLARVTIDSDLTRHAMRAVVQDNQKGGGKKKNKKG